MLIHHAICFWLFSATAKVPYYFIPPVGKIIKQSAATHSRHMFPSL
jgi:hypothetical protein